MPVKAGYHGTKIPPRQAVAECLSEHTGRNQVSLGTRCFLTGAVDMVAWTLVANDPPLPIWVVTTDAANCSIRVANVDYVPAAVPVPLVQKGALEISVFHCAVINLRYGMLRAACTGTRVFKSQRG